MLRGLHYLGGHPAAPNELDRVDMSFDAAGVTFERGHDELGAVPWSKVHDLSVDAESATSRMTVPRVWLFGVFAILFRKTERHVLLRLADERGAWVFEVDGITIGDLRAGITELRQRYVAV